MTGASRELSGPKKNPDRVAVAFEVAVVATANPSSKWPRCYLEDDGMSSPTLAASPAPHLKFSRARDDYGAVVFASK